MKYLLLIAIKTYWLIPQKNRRECLFHESCSKYVFRITKTEGFIKGIKCLNNRFKKCNSNYKVFITSNRKEFVLLNDGSVVSKEVTTL